MPHKSEECGIYLRIVRNFKSLSVHYTNQTMLCFYLSKKREDKTSLIAVLLRSVYK